MLQLAGIAVDALSVGGMATCIQLPGFDMAFDMGHCPRSAVHRSRVLFTHAHIDHMGGVVHHCATRKMMGLTPPTYAMPTPVVPAFQAMLEAWRALDGSDLSCQVVPVQPGEELSLRSDLVARPFRSPHRILCQGYVLYARKEKLLPALAGTPGRELARRRKAGEVISHTVDAPEVAFTGDTLIEGVLQHEDARKARLLIMEVTFLDDRVSVASCRDKGHIHLDEVIAHADQFENQAILFTHLSARYKSAEARKIVARRLPAGLRDRVTLLGLPW